MEVIENVREVIQIGVQLEKEQFFKIKDVGFVFEILRSRLYSNPLRTMIQEIISNAVDANIENGKSTEPIEIKLPDIEEQYLIIKDKGIGISPERMSDVFISYGSSTKSKTNEQIGGFGIGAKLPFAYTDSFYIETTSQDRMYRRYQAYLDKTNVGKLKLLEEKISNEQTGTSIIIPCLFNDFRNILLYIQSICKYFKVKPKISDNFKWESDIVKLYGIQKKSEWEILNNGFKSVILIGEIPYILDIDKFSVLDGKYGHFKISCNNQFFLLKFKVGEISVSASREQIEITRKNYLMIARRMQKMAWDVHNYIKKCMNSYTNFYYKSIWSEWFKKFGRGFNYSFFKNADQYISILEGSTFSFIYERNLTLINSYRLKDIPIDSTNVFVYTEWWMEKDNRRIIKRVERVFELNLDAKRVIVLNFRTWNNIQGHFDKIINNGNTYQAIPLRNFECIEEPKPEVKRKEVLKKVDRNITLDFFSNNPKKIYSEQTEKYLKFIENFKRSRFCVYVEDDCENKKQISGIIIENQKKFKFPRVYILKKMMLKDISKVCKVIPFVDYLKALVEKQTEYFIKVFSLEMTRRRFPWIWDIINQTQITKHSIIFNKIKKIFKRDLICPVLSFFELTTLLNQLRICFKIEVKIDRERVREYLTRFKLINSFILKNLDLFVIENVVKLGIDHFYNSSLNNRFKEYEIKTMVSKYLKLGLYEENIS